jgi:FAD synthase
MRPEIKFDSLQTLVIQMDQDSGKAREILKSLK